MQILVVIDSIPLLTSVVGIVSDAREGWTIGYLDNAPGAMELARAMKPDVLILEFQLWMDSKLDVIKHIKETVPLSKVVVITGAPYLEYRNKSLVSGADYFFNLDLDLDDFCQTLKGLGPEFASSHAEFSNSEIKQSLKGEMP